MLGVGEEVLAHLAPVEDAGGGDGDGFGFSEGSGLPLGALLEFFELRFGGVEKRFALSGTFGGDAGVVADDEALAGEEGAFDFGKPVPVEEGGLEVGVVDQGLDLVGTQRGDPVELRAGAEVLADAGGGDHAAVADPDEALCAEAPLDLLELGGEGLGVGGVAGEDLDADGAAILGGEESDDDLGPVGAMVAGVAVGGEFTAASLEVGGGDVVEDEACGVEVSLGEAGFDVGLVLVEPVEGLVGLVVSDVCEAEEEAEGGGGEVVLGGVLDEEAGDALGFGEEEACDDEGGGEVAGAGGCGVEVGGKAGVSERLEDGEDVSVGEAAEDAAVVGGLEGDGGFVLEGALEGAERGLGEFGEGGEGAFADGLADAVGLSEVVVGFAVGGVDGVDMHWLHRCYFK